MLTPNLRLLRLLGRGGMGSVWLAEHLTLGCEVAVKLLSTDLANDPEALERFRREATAVAQLKSPHVVGIHDFGDVEGVPFFVMEQLVGEDLGQRLERVRRLPIGIATAIVVQTCKALARVHELGIVHRDLKPGNIFLTNVDGDLVVKLLDFGVAKTRPSLSATAKHVTSDQAVLGTPLYMSPEQFLSPRDVGPASDLYSLAVVIYECIAGQPPFDGETVGALHVAIASGRYIPITGVDRTLPLALDGWFARAFASEPKSRFQSAREMSDAFLEAARGRASFAADETAPHRTMPAVAAAAAAGKHPSIPAASLSTAVPTASFLPFIAGVLAVLVLIGGIFVATRTPTVAKRAAAASSSASSSSADMTTPPTPPPTPGVSETPAASAASVSDSASVPTAESDTTTPASSSSSQSASSATSESTNAEKPATPPRSGVSQDRGLGPRPSKTVAPRRKNRGF